MPARKSGGEEKPKKSAPAKKSAAKTDKVPAAMSKPTDKPNSREKPKTSKAKAAASSEPAISDKPAKSGSARAYSASGCDREQLDAQKLAAAGGGDPDQMLEDSRIFKMLQGQRLSPEEARESAVNQRNLLIESWNSRDELYRELFGEPRYVTPGPYAPPPVLKAEDVILPEDQKDRGETGDPGDPNLDEQHLNVLVYAPDPTRPYWTYVTAGLSSPWLQDTPAEVTGFGCEIMIKSKEDMPWAPQILRTLAFYILNHAGTLSPGVRIDLNGPIIPGSNSKLTNIFIWYPDDAPDCWYYLPSGGFGLFIAIGITPDERQFAESIEEYGTWCIQQVLRQMGHEQVTDPYRGTVMDQEGIGLALLRTKSFADNFRANVAYGTGDFSES